MNQSRPLFIWQKIYFSITESMPNGMTVDDLMKRFNLTKVAVYSQIHLINHSNDEELKKIVNLKGIYFISDEKKIMTKESKQPCLQRNRSDRKEKFKANQIIPESLLKTINELSESDKNDFKDLLKKSIFYGKSSIALLEANQQVNSLLEGING